MNNIDKPAPGRVPGIFVAFEFFKWSPVAFNMNHSALQMQIYHDIQISTANR